MPGIRAIGAQAQPDMALGWLREQLDNPDEPVRGVVVIVFDGDNEHGLRYMHAGEKITRKDIVWAAAHIQHDQLVEE